MISGYKYALEEQWIRIQDIGISKEFYNKIKNSNYKIIEEKQNVFKFTYVGIIMFNQETIIILPKYYDSEKYNNELECMIPIINVFKKYPRSIVSKNKDTLIISRELDDEFISEIAIADYLIKDYIDNGYYNKSIYISSLKNKNAVEWNKTINNICPIISNGYPIYNDYYSKIIKKNTNDIIYKIYRTVLEYSISKYGELLGYKIKGGNLNKTIEDLEQIGNFKSICGMIYNELQVTYNDRNINVLKCLYKFFDSSKEKANNNLQLYGTTSFQMVWEFVCGYVFKNEYYIYKDDISNPKWKHIYGEEIENKKNTLKPDIIRKMQNEIIIVDAKYYSIKLTRNSVEGNPGTYDIVKQYTYEIALKKKYQICNITNILLYPKDIDERIELFGQVQLDIFDLDPILNVFISPRYIFNLYIKNKKLSIEQIKKIIKLKEKTIKTPK